MRQASIRATTQIFGELLPGRRPRIGQDAHDVFGWDHPLALPADRYETVVQPTPGG
jgi:hypothetical protein